MAITPILAEASNSFMGQLVYSLLALVAGIAAGVGIMAVFRKPAPTQLEQPIKADITNEVQVRSLDKYATRDFCDMRHRDVTGRIERVEKDVDGLRGRVNEIDGETADLIREEVGKVHNRVNAIEKDVGGVLKGLELQNQQLARMETKLDRKP